MSEKFKHEYDNSPVRVCKHCYGTKGWVDGGIISRRCTRLSSAFWAGRYARKELMWTRGEVFPLCGIMSDTKYPPFTVGSVIYDSHYDIDERALAVAETLLVLPVAPHMAGIDPEQVDWAKHKAFMGEQR